MIMERLKMFIDSQGITIKAFERSIGMSNASFGKSLKNGGNIGSDKVENILQVYPQLNPLWLLTGEGSMILGEEAKSSSNQEGLRHGRFVRVTTHYTQEEENVNYINIDNITSFLLKEGSILINTSDGKRHKVTDNVSGLFEALL